MEISDLHQAALEWAAEGVPVFPCRPFGSREDGQDSAKRPAVAGGWKVATTDKAQIDAWWTENPRYNVAIYPEPAGLCVIDTDPPTGEENWNELVAENPSKETYTHRTPRDGIHRFYRGSLPGSASRLAPKVDTRGVASYVLVPPSRTDAGLYRAGNGAEILSLPAWVSERLSRPLAVPSAASAGLELDLPENLIEARSWLRTREPAHQNAGGDTYTLQTCFWLRDKFALSEDGMFDVMVDWNARCEPPWEEWELRTKIANAWSYAENQAGTYAGVGLAALTQSLGVELDSFEEVKPAKAEAGKFKLWTMDELLALPPLEWLVPGAIPKNAVGMIYAPPDSYKSFLALAMVMPLAMKYDVVYVAGEGSRQFGKRINAWCLLNNVDPRKHKLRVVRHMPSAAKNEWQGLIEAIREADVRPVLVIIDTMMQAMTGLEDSSSKDVSTFTYQMHQFAEACGSAVLFVHHTGKDASRGARGSSALMGDIEFALEVVAHQATHAALVRVVRQKDAERRGSPFYFAGHEVGNSLAFSPIDAKAHKELTTRDDQLTVKKVGIALRQFKEPVSTKTVAEVLYPMVVGSDPDEWHLAITELVKALNLRAGGELSVLTTGKGNTRLWTLSGIMGRSET